MTEVEIFKQSLDVSRIVMLITIIMTIISATFSALTLAFQRSHNKKTVKPLCDSTKIADKKNSKIAIKNAGLGPMIIRSITVREPDREAIEFSDFCESLLLEKADCIAYKKPGNMILSVNEERTIFELNTETKVRPETANFVFGRLSNAEIKINYSDIYDKEYTYTI